MNVSWTGVKWSDMLPFATFSFKLYLKSCNLVNFENMDTVSQTSQAKQSCPPRSVMQ